MLLLKILVLAAVQGAAELLPVSSSAHVIVAEKLMGLNPTSPQMTLLLVMLHTGTMFAVIYYFWDSWKAGFFASRKVFINSLKLIAAATFFTGVVGLALKSVIEKFFLRGVAHAQIEMIFGNLNIIAAALAAVGVMIIYSQWKARPLPASPKKELSMGTEVHGEHMDSSVDLKGSSFIGIIQGLCLPFRGFSRSGATISAGMLLGMAKDRAEEFSFALAVVLTPPVVAREVWRVFKDQKIPMAGLHGMAGAFYPSLLGMAMSFIAGVLALKWLSNWLSRGRWHFFGIYCLAASAVVFALHLKGF